VTVDPHNTVACSFFKKLDIDQFIFSK